MAFRQRLDVLRCRWEKEDTFISQPSKPKGKRVSKGRGGRPRAAEVERRFARLREVAIEVFVEFGYERASLTEIARRAGASKETLYSRYASKEEFFVACVEHRLGSVMQPFSDLLEEHGSLERNLRDFGFRLLTLMLADGEQNIALVVYSEAHRFPQLGRRFWKTAHLGGEADVAAFMKKQIERGLLQPGDPLTMAQHFLYMVTARVIILGALNVERTLTATQRRKYADQATETFLRAFGV